MTPTISSFKRCVLAFSMLSYAAAFVSTSPLSTAVRLHLPTSTLRASPSSADGSQVELWLDLRNTAILPSAALDHMLECGWLIDESKSDGSSNSNKLQVNRVLVSEDDVQRVLKQEIYTSDDGPEILYISDEDDSLHSVDKTARCIGGAISLQDGDAFADPLPALDILSRNGWVVIDSGDIQEDNKRDEAVTGLVQFLAAGASAGSSGSLLLGGKLDENDSDSENTSTGLGEMDGGIVLSCTSKTDVLRAGVMSQSIQSSSSLTTSAGGILIQNEGKESKQTPLNVAVAVPFDAILWASAGVVFGGDNSDV